MGSKYYVKVYLDITNLIYNWKIEMAYAMI